jgi:hypothetical protein
VAAATAETTATACDSFRFDIPTEARESGGPPRERLVDDFCEVLPPLLQHLDKMTKTTTDFTSMFQTTFTVRYQEPARARQPTSRASPNCGTPSPRRTSPSSRSGSGSRCGVVRTRGTEARTGAAAVLRARGPRGAPGGARPPGCWRGGCDGGCSAVPKPEQRCWAPVLCKRAGRRP